MAADNVLIMIHGMTPAPEAGSHQGDYDTMLKGLVDKQSSLRNAFAKEIFIEWGHRPRGLGPGDLRPDQRIMDAENTLHKLVGFDAVSHDRSHQNHLLSPFTDPLAHLVNGITGPIKERIEMYGVTDVMYYVAPDGEEAVRAAVYTQVLAGLEEFRGHQEVRLHLINHSLGVTVSHDFLFGLFAPDNQLTGGQPGFLDNPLVPQEVRDAYAYWRGQAHRALRLGSMASTASQLPLMVMRKQRMVDALAAGATLDPSVIGINSAVPVQWRIFYDLIDVLGFPSRRLYGDTPAIEEFQVDNGANPGEVHSRYWTNDTVLTQVADLLKRNIA